MIIKPAEYIFFNVSSDKEFVIVVQIIRKKKQFIFPVGFGQNLFFNSFLANVPTLCSLKTPEEPSDISANY